MLYAVLPALGTLVFELVTLFAEFGGQILDTVFGLFFTLHMVPGVATLTHDPACASIGGRAHLETDVTVLIAVDISTAELIK